MTGESIKELKFDYEISIDETALDVEWLRQASLMGRYCRAAADAKKELDIAKEALDVVRAGVAQLIRKDPGSFGLDKVTEAAVNEVLLTNSECQRASTELIEAKYELEMAQAAVKALDQKKSALENLVKLHGQSYFAGPSVPRDLSKEWETKQRQQDIDKKVQVGGRGMSRKKGGAGE